MSRHIPFSRRILITAAIIMLFTISDRAICAEFQVYKGITTSITPDEACEKQPDNFQIVLVLEGKPEGAVASGWFFGAGTSTAEIRSISPLQYEVIYPVTRLRQLPPSHMELAPVKGGLLAVIRDHIPSEKEVREDTCFFKKMEVTLKPLEESPSAFITRATELFSAELLLHEGSDFLFIHREYLAAEAKGHKALALLEKIYGKLGREALNASAIIAFSLMQRDRFDEALEVIMPYRTALPDNEDLKELEGILQNARNKQDKLFRYDPDSKSITDMEPSA